MVWRWNRFKIAAYVATSLLLAEFVVLFVVPIARGKELVLVDALMIVLMILTSLLLCLVLRDEPSRFSVETYGLIVDFGLLAGKRRFLSLSSESLRNLRIVPGGMRIVLANKEHSWIVWGHATEDVRRALQR